MYITLFIDEYEATGSDYTGMLNPTASDQAMIELAKEPYKAYWADWIKDKSCFLTAKEIEVLDYFHALYTRSETGIKLGMGMIAGKRVLRNVLRKLMDQYPAYWEYEKKRNREAPADVPKGSAKYKFLHTPIQELPISSRLRRCLLSGNLHTLYDVVLAYSTNDLLSIKGLGKMALCDLENILAENGCGYMLAGVD